jgi:phosphoserine phosphatase RsbU/P
VFTLPDGRLGVVVGDVAGSGLDAAVIMGRMRSALRAYVLEAADPGTALRRRHPGARAT